ncbi:MAG UNVERIFIED_CONTAM: hypothetical protein LVR29_21700 [Microcystis novacekii LVE1205-3]|jgi:dihydropteroate synthase
MSNLTAIREHIFAWGKRTYIMGVLTLTPYSFSDGGEFDNVENATATGDENDPGWG